MFWWQLDGIFPFLRKNFLIIPCTTLDGM